MNHVASPLHQSKVSSLKMKPKTKLTSGGVSELLQSMQNYIPNPTHMQIVFTRNEVDKFNMQGKWIGVNCLLNLARWITCRADEKNWQTLYNTHCVSTLVRSLQPWFQLMGKWVLLYMSAPFEILLGLLLSNSNDQQVERPVCEVDVVLWQLLQWHRRIAAQGMINGLSPAEVSLFVHAVSWIMHHLLWRWWFSSL